jgi:hypothetical protein
MRDTEKLAKTVLEAHLDGVRLMPVTNQDRGEEDFRLIGLDGRDVPVEVTEAINPDFAAASSVLAGRSGRKSHFPRQRGTQGWLLMVSPQASFKELRTSADDLLHAVEQEGVANFRLPGDGDRSRHVAELGRIGVRSGAVHLWRSGATIRVCVTSAIGIVSGDAVVTAVMAEVRKPDNLRKLSSANGGPGILAVVVSENMHLAWSALNDDEMPSTPCDLPAQIAEVWVIAVGRAPKTAVAWRGRSANRWQSVGSVAC